MLRYSRSRRPTISRHNSERWESEAEETDRWPTGLGNIHGGLVGELRGHVNIGGLEEISGPRGGRLHRDVGKPGMDVRHLDGRSVTVEHKRTASTDAVVDGLKYFGVEVAASVGGADRDRLTQT